MRSNSCRRTSGLDVGEFDAVKSYGIADLDESFRKEHSRILSARRGAGFWLWKPYIVRKTLSEVADGDYVFYCDSGSHFISSIRPLVDRCEQRNASVMVFEVKYLERAYTKRDAFILMDCDTKEFAETRQRLSGFNLWKKCRRSQELAAEWLEYSQDARILTDGDNQMGKRNYEGFIDHRHDQSALSLVTKKRGVVADRDPSQFGNSRERDYPHSTYPTIIQLTRNRR